MSWVLAFGKPRLVDFNAGKTQLALLDSSNNTGAIDVKIDGSVLEEKSYFTMLGLSCLCVHDAVEIINFKSCHTWFYFNKHVHEHLCSVSLVCEAILKN